MTSECKAALSFVISFHHSFEQILKNTSVSSFHFPLVTLLSASLGKAIMTLTCSFYHIYKIKRVNSNKLCHHYECSNSLCLCPRPNLIPPTQEHYSDDFYIFIVDVFFVFFLLFNYSFQQTFLLKNCYLFYLKLFFWFLLLLYLTVHFYASIYRNLKIFIYSLS